MIEQQKQRIEQEMTKLVDDVDKSFLRKMQVKILSPKSSGSPFHSPYQCPLSPISTVDGYAPVCSQVL